MTYCGFCGSSTQHCQCDWCEECSHLAKYCVCEPEPETDLDAACERLADIGRQLKRPDV